MIKKISAALSIFIIGIIIGKYYFSKHEVVIQKETLAIQSADAQKLDSISNAFFNLSQNEILEYTKLKDAKKKYEKADEILGKVILLFLANVQMRMKPEVKSYFVEGKKEKVKIEDLTFKSNNQIKKKPEVVIMDEYIFAKLIAVDAQFMSVQKNMPFKIKSPYKLFKKSNSFEDLEKIKKFNGVFKGSLLITKGKHKNRLDDIELNINFFERDGKIDGTYESKLSHSGDTYSHNRGSGGARQIRKAPKGTYLVETSPNSFMHLRYIEGEDIFHGKYYDDDEFKGLVTLYPVD